MGRLRDRIGTWYFSVKYDFEDTRFGIWWNNFLYTHGPEHLTNAVLYIPLRVVDGFIGVLHPGYLRNRRKLKRLLKAHDKKDGCGRYDPHEYDLAPFITDFEDMFFQHKEDFKNVLRLRKDVAEEERKEYRNFVCNSIAVMLSENSKRCIYHPVTEKMHELNSRLPEKIDLESCVFKNN
jgi:hypothetical protein